MSRNKTLSALVEDLRGVAFLLLCVTLAALAVNQLRKNPLPLVSLSDNGMATTSAMHFPSEGTGRNQVETNRAMGSHLTLAEFQDFLAEKRGHVLDARSGAVYRLGHIPGALSLPRENFESAYARIQDLLETDKDRPLAVYCNSRSCTDSEHVRKELLSRGYSQILMFKGGWVVWSQSGLPEEKE